jgi:hypothetical protein
MSRTAWNVAFFATLTLPFMLILPPFIVALIAIEPECDPPNWWVWWFGFSIVACYPAIALMFIVGYIADSKGKS